MDFEESLTLVADRDIDELKLKREEYGESWCKRGGVGAFMMLARKWDRLEEILGKAPGGHKWNIFSHCRDTFNNSETVLDTVRDLRRYLLLVEAKLVEEGEVLAVEPAFRMTESQRAPLLDLEDEERRQSEDPTGQDNPFGFEEAEDVVPAPSPQT